MGSQPSKLNNEKVEVLPKLAPHFSRRLAEFRRRRAVTTLSEKQLLKDGYEDEYAFAHTIPEIHDDCRGSAMVAPEPTKLYEILSDKDNYNAGEREDEQEEDEEKVIGAVITTIERLGSEETEDEKEVERYRRFSFVEGPRTCPGSPSFRFYLNDSLHGKEDYHGKDDNMKKGWLSDTNVDVAEIVESRKSTEELVTKIKKRSERKGMKFRRVIPRGKPVRNLLNVKSCYYPSCGGHQISRRRLVDAKPATV